MKPLSHRLIFVIAVTLGNGSISTVAQEGVGVIEPSGLSIKVADQNNQKMTSKQLEPGTICYYYRNGNHYQLTTENNLFTQISSDTPIFQPLRLLGAAAQLNQKIYFDNQKFKIEINTSPINEAEHRLTWEENNGNRVLRKIDGRDYYGGDGDLPGDKIDSFSFSHLDKRIIVPKTAYQDLFGSFDVSIYHGVINEENLTVLLLNGGDGAGGYDMALIFKGNQYQGRFLASGF